MTIFPGYRDQSTDLQYKSIDWFLCGGNIAIKKLITAKQAPVMLERHTHVSVVDQSQIYYLRFQNQRGHGVFNIDKLRLIRGLHLPTL